MIDRYAGSETKSDPFKNLNEQQFDQLFEDRSKQQELRRYFGDDSYQDIIELRRHAKRRAVRHEELALILPGIMGSELTVVSAAGDEDHVWLDYWDILSGDLFRLKLGAGGTGETVRATGALRRYYYKLKVQMESLGYDAEFFPFDWRLSIRDSAKALADYVERTGRPVHIIAHSMGGLVARAAAEPGTAASTLNKKVVMLGTPNYGSFSPVLAFRGSHEIARKLAFLDIHHSNDEYRSELFMGFPGLYEMLPSTGKADVADLFDLSNWPLDDFTLSTDYLSNARDFQQTLYECDDRFYLIAGVNNETIVSARPDSSNRQFVYENSLEGDGTVPLSCCLLDSAKTYYSNTEHGALPNDKTVGYAAYDLLRDGSTTSLETSWSPIKSRLRSRRVVTDQDLFQEPLNIDREVPTDNQVRELLTEYVSLKTSWS
jgi:pimeloyl-ACP methyl ester carboxylesterase